MRPYILEERSQVHIINLEKTMPMFHEALSFVEKQAAGKNKILFVGTKKQAQDPVKSYAEKCGMPYINERWLGGLLTNFQTVRKSLERILARPHSSCCTGPFRGLFSFHEEHAGLFFGRDTEIDACVERLRNEQKAIESQRKSAERRARAGGALADVDPLGAEALDAGLVDGLAYRDEVFDIVEATQARLREIPGTVSVAQNWGACVKKLAVTINDERARRAGISKK